MQNITKSLIAIPTLGRAYDIEKTSLHFVRKLNFDYKYFVDESEYRYYAQVLKKSEMVVVEDNLYLCGKIQKIGEYAEKKGYKYIQMIDDDMCFKRKGTKKAQIADVMNEILHDIEEYLDSHDDVGIVSVAKPMEYMRYKGEDKFKEKKRSPIYGTYSSKPKYFTNMKREYILFSDLIASAMCVVNGEKIVSYVGGYEDAITQKNKGGLQMFDRSKLGEEAYKEIVKDFPKIVKSVDKRHGTIEISVAEYFK